MSENNKNLYLLLLKEVSKIRDLMKNTKQYPTFLTYSEFNARCNEEMLIKEIKPRQDFFEMIPGLKEECNQCWKFYLEPRNKSIKNLDVVYGNQFELAFIAFLSKLSINSAKADTKNKILPDNLILDKKNNILAYYEVKYHNAPFVMRYKFSKGRECYEGSLTLDFEKVQKQIKEIRSITDLPVLYLHWIDFPCIKGIFYMTLEETNQILKEGIEFERKKREGDFVESKGKNKKVGYLSKFYPSILKMKSLEEFINLFQE